MKSVLETWHLLLLILAGWINHRQQDAIEYLRTGNQILREKLGKKRILLDDDQRRPLAVKGKILVRKMLVAASRPADSSSSLPNVPDEPRVSGRRASDLIRWLAGRFRRSKRTPRALFLFR